MTYNSVSYFVAQHTQGKVFFRDIDSICILKIKGRLRKRTPEIPPEDPVYPVLIGINL
jgi:hypothetical protein